MQLTEKQKQVIQESIQVFGLQTQFVLLREEAAELIQAITKAQRFVDKASAKRITEEMVDLQIMIYTLTFDKPLPDQVKDIQDNFQAIIYEVAYLIGQSILFELVKAVEGTAFAQVHKRTHNDHFLESCQNIDHFIDKYKAKYNTEAGLGFDEILEAKIKRLERRIENFVSNEKTKQKVAEQKAMREAINGKN